MFLGKIIGSVWSTRKYESLKSMKLMFVQPMNANYEETDEPIVAVDTVAAGPGDGSRRP